MGEYFGEEQEVEVFSTDFKYCEDGHEKNILSEAEIACLNWFVENVDIADYKAEILAWCNEQYEMVGEESITEEEMKEELFISSIAINVTGIPQSKDGFVYPEIGFYGECECEPEHGICIGFRNKKFFGIDFQDWIL